MHNVEKWSNIFEKFCRVNNARFLKYVWPFSTIRHERVHSLVNEEFMWEMKSITPPGKYMFKVNNKNTRTRRKFYSKLTIKTPKWCHWPRSGVFVVNSENILQLVLVFLLSTLSRQMPAGTISLRFYTLTTTGD